MRGRGRREFVILAAVLIVLGAISAYLSWIQSTGPRVTPLAYDSNAPGGGRALALWLEAQGYQVDALEYTRFSVPASADVLLVLAPLEPFTESEMRAIDRWLRNGHTLIIACDVNCFGSGRLLPEFDVELDFMAAPTDTVRLAQPVLRFPPIGAPLRAPVQVSLRPAPGAVVHAHSDGEPVLLSLPRGSGTVWVTTLTAALDNVGLRNDANARLVANLLATAVGAHSIVFDEIHHGRTVAEESFDSWLRTTPAGVGALFAVVVLFVFAVISGRRFGRPLPPPQLVTRRAPEEYILAMANLFRRGGLRGATARHYHDRLKRALGQPYRLDPRLADPDFVTELMRYREDLDGTALLRLLRDLSRGDLSEAELLRLAREADRWGRRDR